MRQIVRIKLSIIAAAAILTIFGFQSYSTKYEKVRAFSSGPAASYASAPGEANCTACHTGNSLNDSSGNLTISGLPANYLPNQQIPVTVTINRADAVIFGFQITAIDSLGKTVGTFTLPTQTPLQMQLKTGNVGGNPRQYVEHTSSGVIPTQFGTKSWTFTWNTPPQRVGLVSFYAAGNAANSDGGTSGDFIYTTSKNINDLAQTATTAVISGRVTTRGRGLARAQVMISDSNGMIQRTMTNPLGFYRFENVAIGSTYIFEVKSKRYTFAPQVVTVSESISDLNFTGQ